MFSLSSAWVNAAKPTVEVGTILSQSQRSRRTVILQGEVRTLSRGVAHKSGLGLPLVMADVTEMVRVVVLLSPPQSPPQSDDEDDGWKYEC